MSNVSDTWSWASNLRDRAQTRLTDGSRLDLSRASTSEAMAVLFKLASSPSTAGDARALLHELQVHQVEVEMQQEELLKSRLELESGLMRLTALIAHAPAALLLVDDDAVLCEINPAGARMLGVAGDAGDALLGRPLTSFLSAPGGDELHKMLTRARTGAEPQTCELQLAPQAGVTRKLLCSAGTGLPSGHFVLALLAPASPG